MNQNYDHQEDHSEQQGQEVNQNNKKLQELQNDYNLAKLSSEINEAIYLLKSHDSQLRKAQKDIELRVTDSQLIETIAYINLGIHSDPNIIKLLKTREQFQQCEETDKLKLNSQLFSRKLNQMSESLTMLLSNIKKLDNRVTTVEADLTAQLNQKYNQLQIQVQQARGDQIKQSMQLQHKMEVLSFQMTDKLRDIQTKVNWKLNQFKSKIDQKINEELVKIYLQQSQKKMDRNMREYQLKSNIDPQKIERMDQQIQENRLNAANGITACNFQIENIQNKIHQELVLKEIFQDNNSKVQKRLNLFYDNFHDVYSRVKKCESEEIIMDRFIKKLLIDAQTSIKQLGRINTVLLNLKIGQDFQKMLQEMNPSKVLQLQDKVDGVRDQQSNIFKEIQSAKRQIDKINAKSEIMGVMQPNKARDKLKKQELHEALNDFLIENQFAQKIATMDRQLGQYKISIDSINLLNRQVSRMQKQNDTQRLSFQFHNLEEYLKKQISLMNTKIKQKLGPSFDFNAIDRPGSKGQSSYGQYKQMGESFHQARSFSVKKVSGTNLLSSSRQLIMNNINKQLQVKTSKRN